MKMFFYKIEDKSKTDVFILDALEKYLKQTGTVISDKTIYRTENGKPYFAENKLFVGVSHSQDVLLIAFDDKNFGIDCEKFSARDINKISKRFFSLDEQEFINSSSDALLAFLTVWTKKEAYIKCFGKTLSSLSNVDTTKISGFETTTVNDCVITVFRPQ